MRNIGRGVVMSLAIIAAFVIAIMMGRQEGATSGQCGNQNTKTECNKDSKCKWCAKHKFGCAAGSCFTSSEHCADKGGTCSMWN